jgi:antagonist of KipI
MMGSIQIPGNGNPIILMSDRGVTGGYPKIATIISSDISKIAQALPGDKIKFLVISNREAESILIETENLIQKIYENSSKSLNERLNILINDISFEVIDEENELITTKESFDPIDIEMIAARVKTTDDEHDFNIEIRRQSE